MSHHAHIHHHHKNLTFRKHDTHNYTATMLLITGYIRTKLIITTNLSRYHWRILSTFLQNFANQKPNRKTLKITTGYIRQTIIKPYAMQIPVVLCALCFKFCHEKNSQKSQNRQICNFLLNLSC